MQSWRRWCWGDGIFGGSGLQPQKRTYGVYLATDEDSTFLIVPNGIRQAHCKGGPCIRLK